MKRTASSRLLILMAVCAVGSVLLPKTSHAQAYAAPQYYSQYQQYQYPTQQYYSTPQYYGGYQQGYQPGYQTPSYPYNSVYGQQYYTPVYPYQNQYYQQSYSYPYQYPYQQYNPLTVSCYATVSTVNVGTPVTWYANVTGGSGQYSYAWSAGNTYQTNTNVVSSYYPSPGTYSASVVVTSDGQTISRNCGNVTVQQLQYYYQSYPYQYYGGY